MKLNRFRPLIEALDQRALLSITLTNGLVECVGATTADVVNVTIPSTGKVRITDDATGDDRTFDLVQVKSILIRSRAGDDTITVDAAVTLPVEIRAWAGTDNVLGGSGNDTILGGGGDDSLDSRGGDDTIIGQAGGDDCHGGDGNDRLIGDFTAANGIGGNDTLNGDDGNDTCDGGVGDDSINGGAGDDDCNGEGGDDSIRGDDGNDTCDGGSGDDTVRGDDGDDTVRGDDGNDTCDGGGGDDSVDGGDGTNTCGGGGGTDTVTRGQGNETELQVQFAADGGAAFFLAGQSSAGAAGKIFDIFVQGATVNATAEVLLDSTSVGTVELGEFGDGRLTFDTTSDNFPANFPTVRAGTVVTVKVNGATVRQATFAGDDSGGGGGSSGGGSGGGGNSGGGSGGGGNSGGGSTSVTAPAITVGTWNQSSTPSLIKLVVTPSGGTVTLQPSPVVGSVQGTGTLTLTSVSATGFEATLSGNFTLGANIPASLVKLTFQTQWATSALFGIEAKTAAGDQANLTVSMSKQA